MSDFTNQEKAFLTDYVGHGIVSRACRAVGKPRPWAYRLLKTDDAINFIEEHYSRVQSASIVRTAAVIDELSAICFSDATQVSDSEMTADQLAQLGCDQKAAIKSISTTYNKSGDRVVSVVMHDKVQAIKLMMKHLGIDNEILKSAARDKSKKLQIVIVDTDGEQVDLD